MICGGMEADVRQIIGTDMDMESKHIKMELFIMMNQWLLIVPRRNIDGVLNANAGRGVRVRTYTIQYML